MWQSGQTRGSILVFLWKLKKSHDVKNNKFYFSLKTHVHYGSPDSALYPIQGPSWEKPPVQLITLAKGERVCDKSLSNF